MLIDPLLNRFDNIQYMLFLDLHYYRPQINKNRCIKKVNGGKYVHFPLIVYKISLQMYLL